MTKKISQTRFDFCFNFTLSWEGAGGEVEHDPHDPGGTTKWGIDQSAHPQIDVASLTIQQAKQIYFEDNWEKFACGQLNPPWDLLVFDSSVNPGPAFVVRALQASVGAEVDGVIGPQTIARTNAAGPTQIHSFIQKRLAYYAARSETLKQHYLAGWEHRTYALESQAVRDFSGSALA